MNVTPEIVRAEMDYRVERALAGAEVEYARQTGHAHRSWFRRLRDNHHDEPRTGQNEAPLAA